MANSLFEINNVSVDMKEYTKVRCTAALNDTISFKFLVFDNNSPVDLSKYGIEFRARLSASGQVYSETDNISFNGNELTVNCDSRLCAEIGEQIITLRIFDIVTYQQKSNYIIVLKVKSTIDSDEEIQSSSVLSALSSLDVSINRYVELKADLNGEIIIGQTLLQNLKDQNTIVNATISNAQTINTTLTTTHDNANILNNDLKNNINSATNLNEQVQHNITDLNSNISVARYNLNELGTQNLLSQTYLNTLKSENQLAGQQITTMQHFGDINELIRMINNLTITQNSINHLLDLVMDSNPLYWTDDEGDNVIDDDGNNIRI